MLEVLTSLQGTCLLHVLQTGFISQPSIYILKNKGEVFEN